MKKNCKNAQENESHMSGYLYNRTQSARTERIFAIIGLIDKV